MKRILTIISALFFMSSLSAQVLASYDFEDGTYDTWRVWTGKKNVIVGADQAKDSQHALKVGIGTYFDLKGVKAKNTYKVSADVSPTQDGKKPGYLRVEMYDPKSDKLVQVHRYNLPTAKGYQRVETTFKSKLGGYHRVTFAPEGSAAGCMVLIDNVKVEKISE